MSKSNTQNKIELTSLQQALIDLEMKKFCFVSHDEKVEVNVEQISDKVILMLLAYGVQRRGNDTVNGIISRLNAWNADPKHKNDQKEIPTVMEALKDFCDKIITGDFSNKSSKFDSVFKEVVKEWLKGKGFANTKSFDKEVNKLSPLDLLKTFTKGASEEDTQRRYEQLKAKTENLIATKAVDDIE